MTVPTTKIEFLGTMTDFTTMVLLLSSEGGINNQSLSGSSADKIQNSQKPRKFSFAYSAILQAPINWKWLQMTPNKKSKEKAKKESQTEEWETNFHNKLRSDYTIICCKDRKLESQLSVCLDRR